MSSLLKKGMPHSLEEVHASVNTSHPGFFKRIFAFMGPAYLVSVGYMDPGNWATDLEGGSRFGYALIWVLLMSNLMAILLQTLAARLGIVTGRDLAQACRSEYPKPIAIMLWLLGEIAIAATDLAEALGTILGLNLLFGLPLLWGAVVTLFDTFLLLAIQRLGIRKMEAFIVSLVGIIGLSFVIELFLSKPDLGGIAAGFVPSLPPGALFVAIGMIGATVMPHNLYLHSALVQTRKVSRIADDKAKACKYNLIDSAVALNGAFFVNAAILIVAAATFMRNGVVVTEIQQAHHMLDALLGHKIAPIAFGVALLAAGQSSTLTGTMAGQVVMEGFINLRLQPWMRRLITRVIAIGPAMIVIALSGDQGTYKLLILSQVILSLQLPFAIIPLIHFTNDRVKMGAFVNKWWVKLLAWATSIIVIGLNVKLVWDTIATWLEGGAAPWIGVAATLLSVAVAILLVYVTVVPLFRKPGKWQREEDHGASDILANIKTSKVEHIGAALARDKGDAEVISHALAHARAEKATLTLIHVVDSTPVQVYGEETYDEHARSDEMYLEEIAEEIRASGVPVEIALPHGNPSKELIAYANSHGIDLLVMGSHGHRLLGDLLLGQTVDPVRHGVSIPVLVVR